MPRFSRKSKRRSGESENVVEHLLDGWCLACLVEPLAHTDSELQNAWEKLRDVLLADWIRAKPGTRPHAWWRYDAPEPRQRADGVLHPFKDRLRRAEVEKTAKVNPSFRDTAYRLSFGLPTCVLPCDIGIRYESEAEYLRRLNLLTPAELTEIYT